MQASMLSVKKNIMARSAGKYRKPMDVVRPESPSISRTGVTWFIPVSFCQWGRSFLSQRARPPIMLLQGGVVRYPIAPFRWANDRFRLFGPLAVGLMEIWGRRR